MTAILLTTVATALLAQPKDNSPYSRFGLGELQTPTLSAAGFGGLSAAFADPLHLNLLNPAASARLNAATFECGIHAEHANFEFGDNSSKVWSGGLSHIALAFPVYNSTNDLLTKRKRKVFWGMSFGLVPYSTVGYDIETIVTVPEADTTTNTFQGTGGTNRLLWGNSVRYKNFSAGLNIGALFGQLESRRVVAFNELPVSYSDIFQDDISLRGFVWSVGAQQQFNLEKQEDPEAPYTGKALILGAYGNSATSLNTTTTVLRMRFNETLIHRDTQVYERGQKGDGTLPGEFTIGAMYQNPGKLRVGVEYGIAKWSDYELEAKPNDELFDGQRVAVGVEYIPDIASYNNYLRRIRYRAGFFHRTDPRLEDFKQTALTVGFGVPMLLQRQQTSFVNLSFEFGKFSTPDAIQEKYVKMALGFTLNDSSWFYKRKFG